MSTALLDTATPGRVPLRGIVAGRTTIVHSVLDKIQVRIADDGLRVTSADIEELDRIARRVDGARLALIAKADRQQAFRRGGHASTAAWVADTTRIGGGAAQREVTLASTLSTDLPTTAAALSAGQLSAVNAGIVASTMSTLPTGLDEQARSRVETALVRDASRLDPARLRKAALGVLAAAERSAEEVAQHEEDVLGAQERRAYDRAHIHLHDLGDGSTSGRFLVPTGAAHVLRKVLQSMTSPRRDHLRRPSEVALADGQQPAGDRHDGSVAAGVAERNADWPDLDWAHRRGRAFTDLLEHLDTERLTGSVASTIIVTMTVDQAHHSRDAEALRAEVEAATGLGMRRSPAIGAVRSDTGHDHSTHHARRLACGAAIVHLVLDRDSTPLNLGRQQRFFSPAQRLALAAIYDTCAAEGCDRPYAWCELHHEDPWSTGGRTDLALAVPLCGQHHRHLHDPQYEHWIRTDAGVKSVRFRARHQDWPPDGERSGAR